MDNQAGDFWWLAQLRRRERIRIRRLWRDYRRVAGQVRAEDGMLLPVVLVKRLLGVSRQRVHQLMQKGKVRSFRVGQDWLVSGASVESFARERARREGRPFRRPWTPAEDRLLGKDRDWKVAERLGRKNYDVTRRRWRLGIASFAFNNGEGRR